MITNLKVIAPIDDPKSTPSTPRNRTAVSISKSSIIMHHPAKLIDC
ncbi:hypothetical protein [Moraxella cuniculi]|nr:hypothetical protein [Moraxella cuniculi]